MHSLGTRGVLGRFSGFPIMINVLALTQLAFLSLGVVLMRILYRANGGATSSAYVEFWMRHGLWLFLVPPAWVVLALVAQRFNRAPLTPRVAQGMGVLLAVVFFAFFVTVTALQYR